MVHHDDIFKFMVNVITVSALTYVRQKAIVPSTTNGRKVRDVNILHEGDNLSNKSDNLIIILVSCYGSAKASYFRHVHTIYFRGGPTSPLEALHGVNRIDLTFFFRNSRGNCSAQPASSELFRESRGGYTQSALFFRDSRAQPSSSELAIESI